MKPQTIMQACTEAPQTGFPAFPPHHAPTAQLPHQAKPAGGPLFPLLLSLIKSAPPTLLGI